MNTIWVYSKDEPNLRERLMGMEFDRAILSEMAQRDMGIRAHVLPRTRAANAKEQNGHIAQQRKGKIIAADVLTETITLQMDIGAVSGLSIGSVLAITSPVA